MILPPQSKPGRTAANQKSVDHPVEKYPDLFRGNKKPPRIGVAFLVANILHHHLNLELLRLPRNYANFSLISIIFGRHLHVNFGKDKRGSS